MLHKIRFRLSSSPGAKSQRTKEPTLSRLSACNRQTRALRRIATIMKFVRVPSVFSVIALYLFSCWNVQWFAAAQPNAAGQNRMLNDPEVMQQAMQQRRRQQLDAAKSWSVFHQFGFADKFSTSGIVFQHHVVDDAGKYYKAVHYDHGNGVAVADVNGDERLDIYFTTQLGTNRLYLNAGQGRFEDITE